MTDLFQKFGVPSAPGFVPALPGPSYVPCPPGKMQAPPLRQYFTPRKAGVAAGRVGVAAGHGLGLKIRTANEYQLALTRLKAGHSKFLARSPAHDIANRIRYWQNLGF
jgi:hypothetical protein